MNVARVLDAIYRLWGLKASRPPDGGVHTSILDRPECKP